ncbi:hypothetical protein [Methylobacterium sp. NFXW15]|uniref:hypothetical protein n=1 Tax=Methylobacterium sp. NFXW15 TaxID=2819512 RepID=UPI003CF7E84B
MADPDAADGHAAELHAVVAEERHPATGIGRAVGAPDPEHDAPHHLPGLYGFPLSPSK